MPSKAKQSDHRMCVTSAEFAVLCWLRLHPDVAATYGIKECNGKTTIGSMFLQTLAAQGMAVDWYSQLPVDAPGHDARHTNEAGAQYIRKAGTRPGNRLKNLKERLKELGPTATGYRRRSRASASVKRGRRNGRQSDGNKPWRIFRTARSQRRSQEL